MIGHGFTDPVWMAKQLIVRAEPAQVKKAVVDIIQFMWEGEGNTSYTEMIDRLVQVSVTGTFQKPAPHVHEHEQGTVVASFGLNDDGTISEELTDAQQQVLDDFKKTIGINPEEEDKNE